MSLTVSATLTPSIISATAEAVKRSVNATADLATVTKTEDHDYYEGAYVVTPAWATQTLETTEKIMSQNVVVLDIPVSEVGNEAGGLTLTI